ncbi:MAG: D-2-hydroxyacid dehydrogenase [Pseudomonadota bacterium]
MLPQHLIILSPVGEAIATTIQQALPELIIQQGGPEPQAPYALITFTPGPELADYPNASWIHIAGSGANSVLDRLEEFDLPTPPLITRTVGRMGSQIGEYVLSYILADSQKHAVRRGLQQARHWDVQQGSATLIAGQKALILGTGAIGSGVAKALRAMGMIPIGVSRSGAPRDPFETIYAWDALDDLSGIDVCIGALPLTLQTDGLINATLLERLDQALFINVGRGATAHIPDVLKGLEAGHLRHAVLDVVPREPLPPDSPLWDVPDLAITPHVSGITIPEDTSDAFIAAYRALEAGQAPALIVDPTAGY